MIFWNNLAKKWMPKVLGRQRTSMRENHKDLDKQNCVRETGADPLTSKIRTFFLLRIRIPMFNKISQDLPH